MQLVDSRDAGRAGGARRARVLSRQLHLDENLTALGELDRVADQVDDHLPQPSRIAERDARHVRQHVADQLEPPLLGAQRERLEEIRKMIAHGERERLELQLACFDLGEIQDIVEQVQQGVGRVFDHAQFFTLLGGQVCLLQELGHADDAVHRRANLVAHVRKELALRLIGLFRHPFGGGELRRALAHLAIEILGQRTQVAVEQLALEQRLFELLIRVRQPALHAVDVFEQLGDLGGGILRRDGGLGRRSLRRDVAHDRDELLERPRDRSGERAGPEHGAAQRHDDQRERQSVVAGALQPHVEQRLFDEYLPPCGLHDPFGRKLAALGAGRGPARVTEHAVGRARAGLQHRVGGKVFEHAVARARARVNDAIVLIEDRDRGALQRLVVLHEAVEFRESRFREHHPDRRAVSGRDRARLPGVQRGFHARHRQQSSDHYQPGCLSGANRQGLEGRRGRDVRTSVASLEAHP